ncbi:spore germination protein [Lutispora saccharofermentans]|uniref:Spore germination protein n=1 Tax=Lutispora saccharofermentans TaxID=3024236 RepID=A0ABT1NH48_9FIRM|nr:spore germination protein [Lutispora saccharofermentans]MCQ1530486.1 spore germination protein [Lutispora saccharofermentans]
MSRKINLKHPRKYKNTEIEIINENILNSDSLVRDLTQNINILKGIFKSCDDVIFREFIIPTINIQACAVYIDNIVDKSVINDNVINPIMSECSVGINDMDRLVHELSSKIINAGSVRITKDLKDIITFILSGHCLIITDDSDDVILIDSRKFEQRRVSEPQSEAVVIGPREGFIENISVNISLIRKRIKSTELKVEMIQIGKYSKTDIAILYIDGIIDNTILNEVRTRLSKINIDAIIESSYIEQFIEDNRFTPMPLISRTERPDAVTSALLEGRAAIMTDGTPFALLVPSVFIHYVQSSEDYYQKLYAATAIRFLRYILLAISLLGPAIYIAVTNFHTEMVPAPLLVSIMETRARVPFPAIVEALLMEFTFEALREASIRLPKTIGQAVSIVGALVIGQAAVEAGIVSQIMVIVVAVTGIASFATPSYDLGLAIRLLKFPFMALGSILGIFGIMSGLVALLIHLASLESFTVPYLAPLAPIYFSDWQNVIYRTPLPFMKKRPLFLKPRNKNRMGD